MEPLIASVAANHLRGLRHSADAVQLFGVTLTDYELVVSKRLCCLNGGSLLEEAGTVLSVRLAA